MRVPRLSLVKTAALTALLLLADCVVAQEPFPNINEAEGHLYAALDALHRAPPEFRGHKAEAVRLIQAAISQLEIAKQVAD
ncbi:MAG: hypothetical protein WDN25_26745 [Acetobacteraceae bacterium]